MSETRIDGRAGTKTFESGPAAVLGVADCVRLAATPVFLVMALLTAAPGDGHHIAGDASPLGGMAVMYLLMSLFHSPAWLKRMSRRSEWE